MKNRYKVQGVLTIIYLNRKGVVHEAFIDTDDLEKVKEFPNTWCASYVKSTESYYVQGSMMTNGVRKTILLHRWITKSPKHMFVDHYNHNTLDNRKSVNLKVVNCSQNGQNRKGLDKNNTSGARGVTKEKGRNKWRVRIVVNGNLTNFGHYNDFEEAERVASETRDKLGFHGKEIL